MVPEVVWSYLQGLGWGSAVPAGLQGGREMEGWVWWVVSVAWQELRWGLWSQ